MEFTIERQKGNNKCAHCPHIDEWKAIVTQGGKETVIMYGYDPTEELKAKQAELKGSKSVAVLPIVTLVSLEDATEALSELETKTEDNTNQAEIDSLTTQLESVTDKTERAKIKNRINYLKRKV